LAIKHSMAQYSLSSSSIALLALSTVASVTLAACTTPSAEREPSFNFGKLRANLNGTDFVGAFGTDSVIAIYDANAGQLQIAGDEQVRGHLPSLRLFMRCTAFPKAGTYPIKGMRSPVQVQGFLEPTAMQRAWPLHGRVDRAFLSDSMPWGTLELDTIDTVAAVIKGRFSVGLRSFNRSPAETLVVHGTFFGRLRTNQILGEPPIRWTPLFDRDCESIRNAVLM
jgi:hypothetical protein